MTVRLILICSNCYLQETQHLLQIELERGIDQMPCFCNGMLRIHTMFLGLGFSKTICLGCGKVTLAYRSKYKNPTLFFFTGPRKNMDTEAQMDSI